MYSQPALQKELSLTTRLRYNIKIYVWFEQRNSVTHVIFNSALNNNSSQSNLSNVDEESKKYYAQILATVFTVHLYNTIIIIDLLHICEL